MKNQSTSELQTYLLGCFGSGSDGATKTSSFDEAWENVLYGLVLGTATDNIHVGTTSNVEPGVVEMDDTAIILEQIDFFDA